jgi:hypothetical protein
MLAGFLETCRDCVISAGILHAVMPADLTLDVVRDNAAVALDEAGDISLLAAPLGSAGARDDLLPQLTKRRKRNVL